MLAVG